MDMQNDTLRSTSLHGAHQSLQTHFRESIREVCGGIFETSPKRNCERCNLHQCLGHDYSRAMLGEEHHRRIVLLNDTYIELSNEVADALAGNSPAPEAAQLVGELENLARQILTLMRLARNRRS